MLNGFCESKEAAAFRMHAHRLGLKATDFGKQFIALADGEMYVIYGMNPRALNLPVMCMRVRDGKKYRFRADTVRYCLECASPIAPRSAGWKEGDYDPTRPEDGKPLPIKRPEADIIRDLRGIESALSPENLHCDGEISRTEAKRREKALVARRNVLIKELGREPSDAEIWGF